MTAWLAIPAAIVAFVVYHWLLGPVLDEFRRDLRSGRRRHRVRPSKKS